MLFRSQTATEKEPRKVYLCTLCGQPKRRETGHSRLDGVAHCTVASGGKSVEAWLAEQRDATPAAAALPAATTPPQLLHFPLQRGQSDRDTVASPGSLDVF